MTKAAALLMAFVLITLQTPAQHRKEYVDPASIRVNGKLGFTSRLNAATAALGTVSHSDRVSLECGAYFEDAHAESFMIYIKGFMLEKSGNNTCFRSVDFTRSPDAYITFPTGRWDRHTTLASIRRLFPGTAQKSHNAGDADFWIQPAKDADDSWVLHFKNGKLVSVEYRIQC